ncbi:hypothetical protein BB561_003744 [Smittium simulii]|uniref:Uncharacterized protein n=1 Tax=Smittium simulii TaxID=133385 RepID=A0A2T9YJR2_9FUNG|nr:hypothetical protein BB561_003744 [Smittium simulii]
MSNMPNFLSGGAECSAGNPFDSLSKQFNKDKSLEQNHFTSANQHNSNPQQAFRQAFRSQQQQNSGLQPGPLQQDFIKEFSEAHNSKLKLEPFNFTDMNSQLPQMHNNHTASKTWSNDFQQHLNQENFNPQFAAFNSTINVPNQNIVGPSINSHMVAQNNISDKQISTSQPFVYNPMANAFNQARFYAENSQFYPSQSSAYHQVRSNTFVTSLPSDLNLVPQKNTALSQDHSSNIIIDGDLIDAATKILNSTKYAHNSKFKNSKFIDLISDISAHNTDSTSQTPRIVEITRSQPLEQTLEQKNFIDTVSTPGNIASAETGNIFEDNAAISLEKNWSEEFEKSLDGPLNESFVAGNIEDWEKNFDSKVGDINLGAHFTGSDIEVEEWAKIYKDSISSLANEEDVDWEQRNKNWNDPNKQLYRASDSKFDSYSFYTENTFVNTATNELAQFIDKARLDPLSATLSDIILALEASLQKDPLNAGLWTLLGIKQQENEREDAAISALRKAISIDPSSIDAYMAISVSYTNENYYYDAYQSLLAWTTNHPEYSKLVPHDASSKMETSTATKEFIQDLFLKAARSRSGNNWDPDVQIGLGVLFNISEEYNKAVDCFKAALSKRPKDYVIWNKLGATMANSQDPKSATEAYFTALELQPSYVRARFNLAVASMNMHHHKEAAEHLLGALALQKRSMVEASSGLPNSIVPASSMSKNIWDTLKMLMYMLDEPELAESAVVEDLDSFRHKFEF